MCFTPRIVTGKTAADAAERINDLTFAVSGRVADELDTLGGLPVINPLNSIDALADLVEAKVFPQLASADDLGCKLCGHTCRELSAMILRGEADISRCLRTAPGVTLRMQGEAVNLTDESRRKLTAAVQQALRAAGIPPASLTIHIDAESKVPQDEL